MRTEHCHGPAVFHHAGGYLHAVFVHAVVAHAVPYTAPFFSVEALGGDVDCAADRRGGEYGCTEAALCLDVRGNVGEACPVAPVDAAPFHIVDGNTVYEHCHIRRLEAAHVDFGIAEAAAVLGSPDTGSGVENFGKFLSAEFHVDFSLVDLRYCHRGLTGTCQRLCNHNVLEDFV